MVRADKLEHTGGTPFSIARREKEPTDFLPYARHADAGTIVTDGGSLIAVVQLQGASFETLDQSDLNGMHEKINSTLRNLSDERVEWITHTIRERSDTYPGGEFRSDFARSFDAAYRRRTAGEHGFINELYLSIVEKPAVGAADKIAVAVAGLFSKREKVDTYIDVETERLQRFNERVGETIKLLGRFTPRRLTLYEHNDLTFSEPLEVFELILMGRRRRVPLVRGHLGSALYGDRLIFGRELGEVRAHDRSQYFGIFGIREYPAATRPGQLDALLSANYQCCITQSWAPMARADSADRVRKRRRQLISTDDDARSAADALDEAADDLASNHFVMGEHHFSLAVFGDTVRELNDNLSGARSLLADAGLVAVREESANEAAWWAQLPGNSRWRARPAMVTSRNFAALSPFHTYPAGKPDGNHWGPAVMMFQTTALSSYYFSFHVQDVGFTGVIGPTGSGKTVGLNALMAMTEKTGARQIFVDKDRGAEIYIRASGGTYLALKNGHPTGFAPLKGGDYTPHYRAFLGSFVRQLVKQDGRALTVSEERLIDEGLVALGRLPIASRTFGELREVLGFRDAEGIGARLERWGQGGALGWVFDNGEDLMSLEGRFIGFDMTDFLDNAEVRTPIMMYNDVHGLTNIDGVAQLLNSDAAKKWLPSGAQDIEQLVSSSSSSLGSLGQQAANIRAGRRVNLPTLPGTATDADRSRRAALETAGDTAAKNAAIADAAYGATTTRSAGLDQLQQALASATTDKDRQAIQARIAIEVARIQNDTMQLQAVRMRQEAEDRLVAQQLREQRAANIAADAARTR